MPAKRQKPPEMLVNRRGGRGQKMEVVVARRPAPPRCPADVSSYGRSVWSRFWKSRPSHAVDTDADLERLHHWVRCIDERHRLWEMVRQAPLIRGAKEGTWIPNPLARRVRELSKDIERSEEAFGMTPLARFRLQLTFAEASGATEALDERRRRWEERRAKELAPVVVEPSDADYELPSGWKVVSG